MRKIFPVVAIFATAMLLVSCGSLTYSKKTAKWCSVPAYIYPAEVQADLEVKNQKVSANFVIPHIPKKDKTAQKYFASMKFLEEQVVAKALDACGADILIEPQFSRQYEKGKIVSISVSGYPAYYRNFHKYEKSEDTQPDGPQVVVYGAEIHNNNSQPTTQPAPTTSSKRKK